MGFSGLHLTTRDGDLESRVTADEARLSITEAIMGASRVGEQSLVIANAQVVSLDITGLVFDKTVCKAAYVFMNVRRKTDSGGVFAVGRLLVIYRDDTASWDLVPELSGDAHGVVFNVTAAGQVQYQSDNMAGAGYTGKMVYKAFSFAA